MEEEKQSARNHFLRLRFVYLVFSGHQNRYTTILLKLGKLRQPQVLQLSTVNLVTSHYYLVVNLNLVHIHNIYNTRQ